LTKSNTNSDVQWQDTRVRLLLLLQWTEGVSWTNRTRDSFWSSNRWYTK